LGHMTYFSNFGTPPYLGNCLHRCKFLPQYMTTCLGIRNATHWADTRYIRAAGERNSLCWV